MCSTWACMFWHQNMTHDSSCLSRCCFVIYEYFLGHFLKSVVTSVSFRKGMYLLQLN